MMNLEIRKATKADLRRIRELVVELAIYEKTPDAVTVSLEDYWEDFENGWFEVHVAILNNEIVGMILYYTAYSTWKGRMLYLEDFIVREKYRRKGIGEKLFERLFEIAREKNVRLIKWQVLNWNEPAIHFYKKYNVIMEDDWNNCKVFMVK